VVIDRHRQNAFGLILADYVLVKIVGNLLRLGDSGQVGDSLLLAAAA